MSIDVLTDIVIDRPQEAVAAYAAEPSNAPEWYVNITAVEWKTPPPLGVGSRLAFGEPSGFSRIVAPFMAAAMRRANRADLARLKAMLERA